MASEVSVQEFVHSLEQGRGRWWVWFGVVVSVTAFLIYMFLFRREQTVFRGLNTQHGIEQAVISRELVRGNGFSTKVFTPAAIWLIEKKKGKGAFVDMMRGPESATEPGIATERPVPDIYHAPLAPWINSLALRLGVKVNDVLKLRVDANDKPDFWRMKQTDYFPLADRYIAGVGVMFFLLALGINYLIAILLFDRKLALIGVGMFLICDHLWQFSMSGLPQMLMLFLFSLATYCMIRAVIAQNESRWSWPWITGAGVAFGLLTLAHGLTAWLFLGALCYAAFAFKPWWRSTTLMLLIFVGINTPWLIRNAQICGDGRGLGWQSRLFQIRGTESQVMRTLEKPDDTIEPLNFRGKVQRQVLTQADRIFPLFGKIIFAPLFFLGLLHVFKRKETANFRWGILLMWLASVLGMAIFGFTEDELQSNDLHLLFIPLMTFYGLALVLMMWSRLEVRMPLVNTAFLTLLFLLVAPPLLTTFTDPPALPVSFPPYAPSALERVSTWFGEKDVICSDMPWAVAWYGDRKSLWLPLTMQDFYELNDFRFGGKVTGLLLSPVSGYRGLLNEISAPEFAEWAPFIMRQPNARANFPLQAYLALPFQVRRTYPFVLYADRDRWSDRGD